MKIVFAAFCNALLFITGCLPGAFAQIKPLRADTLNARMAAYGTKKQASVLFAHFDKTLYNNSETAWFTAYLLNYNSRVNNPSVLTAILVNEHTRNIALNLKFGMQNGVAHGYAALPDTIAAGNYSFILYTNILHNGMPADTFTQHITIKQTGIPVLARRGGVADTVKATAKKPQRLNVKFYPEGGNLIYNTPCYIGWEVKDATGKPVKLKGILYKNKHFADTIYTGALGMGRFKLMPHKGSTYMIKLIARGDGSTFGLPRILPAGPALHLNRAVVNDTLQLNLMDVRGGTYHVIVHNYQQVFFTFHTRLSAVAKTTTLNLRDVPKGLAIITLLDSLNRPCAERLFFAHYNKQLKLAIATDAPAYGTRQKVTLKLKINNPLPDSLGGVVSVACVQNTRLQPGKVNDIESYFYLKSHLPGLPLSSSYLAQTNGDKNMLENILLVKGWRRYNWQDMMLPATTDTALTTDTGIINATLAGRLNPGGFAFWVNEKAVADTPPAPLIPGQNTLLNTVQIRSTKIFNYIANPCGDYICRFNVLNCPTHKYEKDNTLPVINTRYTVNDSTVLVNNQRVVVRFSFRDDKGKKIFVIFYKGCSNLPADEALAVINGITQYKEFYSSDYSHIDPSQPDYLSTIYWKHACPVNSKHEAELSFFTSDAEGVFTITVEGKTADDVIFAQKEIVVTSPPK